MPKVIDKGKWRDKENGQWGRRNGKWWEIGNGRWKQVDSEGQMDRQWEVERMGNTHYTKCTDTKMYTQIWKHPLTSAHGQTQIQTYTLYNTHTLGRPKKSRQNEANFPVSVKKVDSGNITPPSTTTTSTVADTDYRQFTSPPAKTTEGNLSSPKKDSLIDEWVCWGVIWCQILFIVIVFFQFCTLFFPVRVINFFLFLCVCEFGL